MHEFEAPRTVYGRMERPVGKFVAREGSLVKKALGKGTSASVYYGRRLNGQTVDGPDGDRPDELVLKIFDTKMMSTSHHTMNLP